MLSVRLPHSCCRLETAPTASGLRIPAQFITQGSPAHDRIANIYISSFGAWLQRLEILQGGLEELQLQGRAQEMDLCWENQLALFQGGKELQKKKKLNWLKFFAVQKVSLPCWENECAALQFRIQSDVSGKKCPWAKQREF